MRAENKLCLGTNPALLSANMSVRQIAEGSLMRSVSERRAGWTQYRNKGFHEHRRIETADRLGH